MLRRRRELVESDVALLLISNCHLAFDRPGEEDLWRYSVSIDTYGGTVSRRTTSVIPEDVAQPNAANIASISASQMSAIVCRAATHVEEAVKSVRVVKPD